MAAAIFKAMSKMEAIVSSFALQNTPTLQFTIGEKNKLHPPPSGSLKLGVFLVFNG